MSTDANDFLLTGGSPSAKFPSLGDTVGGTVTRVGEPIQQRDYATGEPKTWDNGDPMMQLPVDVATDLRDPEIDDDDGTRTLYIKGQLKKAVADAIRKSGAKGLDLGGTLTVTYARDGEVKKKGFNAPKIYEATYTPPAAQAAAAFLAEEAPNAPAAAPAATPTPDDPQAAATAALAALAALSPEQRAALGISA